MNFDTSTFSLAEWLIHFNVSFLYLPFSGGIEMDTGVKWVKSDSGYSQIFSYLLSFEEIMKWFQ